MPFTTARCSKAAARVRRRGGRQLDFQLQHVEREHAMVTGVVYDALAVSGATLVGYAQTCTTAYGSFRVDDFLCVRRGGREAAFSMLSASPPRSPSPAMATRVLRGCIHF